MAAAGGKRGMTGSGTRERCGVRRSCSSSSSLSTTFAAFGFIRALGVASVGTSMTRNCLKLAEKNKDVFFFILLLGIEWILQ